MRSYVVPMSVEGSAYFTQTVNLSGQAFSFRFLWNERDQHFYMDVETTDGKKNSVKLVPNNALLGKSSVTDLGDFYLKELHPLNAPLPISVTLLGTSILPNELHP